MQRAPRSRIGGILAILLAGGCIPTLVGELVPEGYRRIEGLPVPEETGPYRIDSVFVSQQVAAGSVIGYVTRDGLPGAPPIELFIYSMLGKTLDEEIALARVALREMTRTMGDEYAGVLAPTTEIRSRYSPHPMYETSIEFSTQQGLVRSHIYVTRAGDKFVVARTAYLASSPAMIGRAMDRHIQRLIDDISIQIQQ